MNKQEVIIRHLRKESYRSIARNLGMSRRTVTKICKEYDEKQKQLEDENLKEEEKDEIVRSIIEKQTYDTSKRMPKKATPAILKRLQELIESEGVKLKILGGNHKQKINGKMAHEILEEEGYEIKYRTMMTHWKKMNENHQEVYIRQEYEYGERVEYDFGEVKLYINGKVEKCHMGVFSAPASGYRWAYLYKNQKMEVFLDSHVRFFEKMKGVYGSVVYDNMRNAVSKFIGREKEYNKQLIQLSLYYGFEIITTNPRAGNEKGSVERSVEVIRKRSFTKRYKFKNFEEAQEHMAKELIKLNEKSEIEEEKKHLQGYRVAYELANLVEAKVNKYSCVSLDNNFYSVPEYLVGKKLRVKKYYDHYEIYSNKEYVCRHKKIDSGVGVYQLEINHYLKGLQQKPGALRNSLALKQCPRLHTIYKTNFKRKEKEFIQILIENKEKTIDAIAAILLEKQEPSKSEEVEAATRAQLIALSQFYGLKESEGEEEYVN